MFFPSSVWGSLWQKNLQRIQTNSSQLFRLQRKKPDKFRSSPTTNRLLSFIRPSRLLIRQAIGSFPPRVRNDKVGSLSSLPSFPRPQRGETAQKAEVPNMGKHARVFFSFGKRKRGRFSLWNSTVQYVGGYFIAPHVWGPAAKFRSNFSYVTPPLFLSLGWLLIAVCIPSMRGGNISPSGGLKN